jgi:tetratricopeptide (TPR) repeat protein
MAVVVFAGEAYSLVPLTTDLNAVAVFLEGVGPGMVALPGSNLQRAVDGSLKLLPDEGEGRVLLLFTDGENLQGDVTAATDALSEAGVGLLGVVAGTERGGPIPEHDERGGVHYKRDQNNQPVVTRAHPEVLAEIATRVDGEVVSLGDPEVVREIADAVARLRTREVEETRNVRRVERFPIFLASAAILLALGFAMSPWRRLATAGVILAVVAPSLVAAQDATQAGSAPRVQAPPTTGDQPPAEEVLPSASWWQRLIPGGSRRLARRGVAKWRDQDLEDATMSFAGAAELDPERPERLYDLGTALAAGGVLEAATPLLAQADEGGVQGAAYNSGTAALVQSQPEPALEWLRRAMLADPDDLAAKHNYELALKMREQRQQQQEQQQDQQQDQQQEQEQQQQEGEGDQQPTPTPSQGQGAAPTPTPNPNQPLFAALERAEAEAREKLRSPTPHAGKVEKDW